jgi:hypothetical protein
MGHVACMGETRNVDCSGDLGIEKGTNDIQVTEVLYIVTYFMPLHNFHISAFGQKMSRKI